MIFKVTFFLTLGVVLCSGYNVNRSDEDVVLVPYVLGGDTQSGNVAVEVSGPTTAPPATTTLPEQTATSEQATTPSEGAEAPGTTTVPEATNPEETTAPELAVSEVPTGSEPATPGISTAPEPTTPEVTTTPEATTTQEPTTTPSSLPRCQQPMEEGNCRGRIPRFYYNGRECVRFSYSGCGGNLNNFQTIDNCLFHCVM